MNLIWCECIEWHDFSDEDPKNKHKYLISVVDEDTNEVYVDIAIYDEENEGGGWWIDGVDGYARFICDIDERVTAFAEMPKGYDPRDVI